MKDHKYIVAYDVETTGLNPKEDFIIQLSAAKFEKSNMKIISEHNWYIEPQHKYEITPAAYEVHKITKEFLKKNGKPMKEIAPIFNELIKDSDILTYNGNTFDIKFLYKDFELAGCPLDFEGKSFYDSFGMECKFTPRTLSAVYKNYVGEEFENAHDALADVKATVEVFKKQFETHQLDFDEIDNWNENKLYSPDGSIRNAANSDEPIKLVFAVGKYKDSDFYEIFKKDPNYIKWYGENVASSYTKKILNEYVKECKNR